MSVYMYLRYQLCLISNVTKLTPPLPFSGFKKNPTWKKFEKNQYHKK